MANKKEKINVTFSLDKEEYEIFKARAKQYDILISRLIRELIRRDNLKPFLDTFDSETINNIKTIGSRSRSA